MLALSLTGKVAVVTGGGRGLGREAAFALASAGAKVALLARSSKELAATEQAIVAAGGKCISVICDVTQEQSIADAAERVGVADILVNNAGIAGVGPFVDLKASDLTRMLDVNVTGAMLCARTFGRGMVDAKRGAIINIASVAGLIGEGNIAAYSASKGAIIAFTRALAVEWARAGVRVNAIAPGYFRTDLNKEAIDSAEIGAKIRGRIPLGRVGEPKEIGPLVVYMASDEASFMTGSIVVIDGGQTAK